MRSGGGMSAMAKLPSDQPGRQLQLVWDTGASVVQRESVSQRCAPAGKGDGCGAISLGAYVSALRAGDECFCCGGGLAEGAGSGGGGALTCGLCGAEVCRSREE
jgi:hypothetical protein